MLALGTSPALAADGKLNTVQVNANQPRGKVTAKPGIEASGVTEDAGSGRGTHEGAVTPKGPWPFAGVSAQSNAEGSEQLVDSSPHLALAAAAASCQRVGDQVTVQATLSGSRDGYVAGQMLLQWDPAKLQLAGVRAGDNPYSVVYALNQAAGSAVVLASIEPGSSAPAPAGNLTCETQWTRVATSAPGAYEIAYDTFRQRTVLVSDGKTWEWDGAVWSLRASSGPAARGAGAMVYDPIGKRCLLFGGYGGSPVFSDLWSWDGATWTLLNSGQIPGRGDFAMAFDAGRNRLVVHGGYNTSFLMSDTCEWNPTSNSWTRISNGPIGPLYAHRMVYDAGLGKVMLHGGFYFYNRSDTWTWDGANWVRIATNGPARYVFGMAYDSRRGEMVIHGGTTCCGEVEYPQTYRFRGGSWQLCGATGPARGYMGMAYDSARDALIISGGMGPSPGGRIGYAETWELRAPASDVVVAKVDFVVAGAACSGTGNEVAFGNPGILKTQFTDGLGNSFVPVVSGSTGFVVDDGAPVISDVPANQYAQAQAGENGFAILSIGTPTVTDACAPGLTATGTRSDGRALSAAWPSGTTTVTWSATDPCGNVSLAYTTVTVDPTNTMDFQVAWSGTGFSGSMSRSLSLTMFGGLGTQTRTASASASDGNAAFSVSDLPVDSYTCATIEDSARTLRRRVSVSDAGVSWSATGALISGDLINDEVIDVLDWGAYVVRNANADLNGDGVTNTTDGDLILANFGLRGDSVCGGSFTEPPAPRTEISVSDLVAMGLPELAGADLNGDGWVDGRDMDMFQN